MKEKKQSTSTQEDEHSNDSKQRFKDDEATVPSTQQSDKYK